MFKPVTYTITIECDKCNEKLTLDLDVYDYDTEDYDGMLHTEFGFCFEPEKFDWKVIKGNFVANPADKTYRCPNHKKKKEK